VPARQDNWGISFFTFSVSQLPVAMRKLQHCTFTFIRPDGGEEKGTVKKRGRESLLDSPDFSKLVGVIA
jgi:hypothetical protein